jgi:hypothetical protein
MKQTQHTIQAYISTDTRNGLGIKEKHRLEVKEMLDNDHVEIDFNPKDSCRELTGKEEVIMDGLEYDEPKTIIYQGFSEILVTFHLNVSSNIEDLERLSAIVFDAFSIMVPMYHDVELSSDDFPR